VIPIRLGSNIATAAGDAIYQQSLIKLLYSLLCVAVRLSILAIAWLLVLCHALVDVCCHDMDKKTQCISWAVFVTYASASLGLKPNRPTQLL